MAVTGNPPTTASLVGIYNIDKMPDLTFQTGATINGTLVSDIAQAGVGSTPVNTAITTVGDGTLTAAALVGGIITRTGSTAAYTDTTATADQIIAALPTGSPTGTSFLVTLNNQTAGAELVTGGTGVTVSGYAAIPSGSAVTYLVTYTAASTVTMYGQNFALLPTTTQGSLATVGAGTITAALFQANFITRTGPVAAFTDTTDTATAIITALALPIGGSAYLVYKNATAFQATIVGGTGVTMNGGAQVPANSGGNYLVSRSGASTILITNYFVSGNTVQNEISTALSTVGAGTITAAGITNGVTVRTGSVAAFTDTTATAAQIVAAWPNAAIGESWEWMYFNNTGFAATLAAGVGITLSGAGAIIPTGGWVRYLVSLTSLTTVAIQGIESGLIGELPPAQFSTGTTATTFTAGQLTGANLVTYTNTQGTPGSIATRTATQMIADTPNAYIGQTWVVRIINGQGTGTLTVTAGTDVTLTGTATVAANTWREFSCIITSITAHTITMQNTISGSFT